MIWLLVPFSTCLPARVQLLRTTCTRTSRGHFCVFAESAPSTGKALPPGPFALLPFYLWLALRSFRCPLLRKASLMLEDELCPQDRADGHWVTLNVGLTPPPTPQLCQRQVPAEAASWLRMLQPKDLCKICVPLLKADQSHTSAHPHTSPPSQQEEPSLGFILLKW